MLPSFFQVEQSNNKDGVSNLRYNFGSHSMCSPFEPAKIVMEPSSGRIYHPMPPPLQKHLGTVALMHTKLALKLAANFR